MIFFLNPSPIFCMAKHPAMLRGTAREEGNSSGLLHSRYFNRQKRNKKERVHRNDVPSLFRAEDEAQTRDPQLGRLMLYQLSYFRRLLWAKMDSNHRRRKPADLQSAPFGHSGICPYISLYKTLNLHLTLYHTHLSFSEECTRLSKIESVRNGCKFRH